MGAVKQEPHDWRNVAIVAGGFVNGVLFHPAQRDLIYAKTDMGGAYRWDATAKRWVPLTDWASQTDWNLRGIESIGLDPNDPKRLYIAAGTYTSNWAGNAAMLRSTDQGKTFQRTDMPFKMGGNEDGRSAGERLAVDPNLGSILYFGSREAGLWKSADYGATWNKVDSFPVTGPVVPTTATSQPGAWKPRSAGITFVVFVPSSGSQGRPTSTIFAGVASADVSLYESADAGATWKPIPGAPKGTLPHQGRLAVDGKTLYVTYANSPGPNGMSNGALWKYDLGSHVWTEISPLPHGGGGGFAGLALGGAKSPNLVMVSTMDHWGNGGDDVFRSIDGGKTWQSLRDKSVRDPSLAPYLKWGDPQPKFGWWIGALALDPFDSAHVMYGTGATIWESRDAVAAERGGATHWVVGAAGLEETAVIDLISPPEGAHLFSGLGDIGGFRHEDLNTSPPEGMLQNPQLDNTDSLDFAERKPGVVVRVGRGHSSHGGYSTDGGAAWTPFATEPAGSRGGGSAAVSADGSTIVWAGSGGDPAYTRDLGATWTPVQGYPQTARVIADRANPRVFYAFSPVDGKVYGSTDGGAHFAVRGGLSPSRDNNGRLRAVPGAEGDLWLTTDGGLYHSTDGGHQFARLKTIDKADSIGFGKAAPGSSYPALYVIGKAGKVEGFFRSDDTGKSWVRINDDQHQYGLVGPIIGDPRIYGRVYVGTNGRGVLYADPIRESAQR